MKGGEYIDSRIDHPCPICSYNGGLDMSVHIDEIPYFGEHTQVTLACESCGWRKTDFIPAESRGPTGHGTDCEFRTSQRSCHSVV